MKYMVGWCQRRCEKISSVPRGTDANQVDEKNKVAISYPGK